MSDPTATFYLKDYVTIVALFLGPAVAVAITLWHQGRTARRDAKQKLFLTLMSYRKSDPPTAEWASALNLIDVVFADNPTVVQYWHTLYQVLNTKPWNYMNYNHAYLDLLSAIAKAVGYKSLQQTDIDKYYQPDAHGAFQARQGEIQQEFLRVLKASETIGMPRAPQSPPPV